MMAVQALSSTEEQAELLRVLGHPMRLAVLRLTGGERAVGIAERTVGPVRAQSAAGNLRKAALVPRGARPSRCSTRLMPTR